MHLLPALLHGAASAPLLAVWSSEAGSSALALSGANTILHLVFSLGLLGIFLVSIVDSSFVPLPIPGVTDIMLVLFAAQHANPWLLVLIATLGSAMGGFFSYQVGQSGGMAFIEKRTPKRIFKRITRWIEANALLAIALPALLPPPMPLSPFVLAAGALKMSRRKFIATFTISRMARHAIAVWLGFHYGRQVLELWSKFSAKWGTPVLIVIWTGILLSVGYAFWQLWKTSHGVGVKIRHIARRPTTTSMT